jgi:hypothetical protein
MRRPNITFVLGCLALIVANVTQFLLRRNGTVPESIADPVNGFLFGIAIATLLLSITRMRRGGCAS